MDPSIRCAQCGSQNVETGRIRGTGRMVFENSKKFFDWGRPMLASACLDCGNVSLRLRNVLLAGEAREPRDLVEQYRKVVAMVVTATDQDTMDEYRRILEELRTKWRMQHGADSLHQAAFGDEFDDRDDGMAPGE
jgi:predicted nucleic-acid-binding Zn-ribbon protein